MEWSCVASHIAAWLRGMSFCVPMFSALVSGPAVALSISPENQGASGFSSSWNFPACTVTVTGGIPSTIVWSFQNVDVGTWSVLSGQGTLTAAARVQSVPPGEQASGDFVCTVTVGGLPYVISCAHSFFNVA